VTLPPTRSPARRIALIVTLAAILLGQRVSPAVPAVAEAGVGGSPASAGATSAFPTPARGTSALPTPARGTSALPAPARGTRADALPIRAGAVAAAGGVVGQAAADGQRAVAGPRLLAKAAILADESTGQVLFERNAGGARAMASTTKVMTALLALEQLDERRVVVIGPGPPQVGEESLRLRQGERLTVRQLLLGLMLKSANDAGVALAEAVDGSEAAFVRRMNRKAAALRLGATHYVTPYGLDRPGHRTSARDLARLWEVAMRRADFRALVATRSARLPGGPLSLRRFVTTNQLLGAYRWTVGGKTGFTNLAGRCLVASASRGGRRLVAVALGSPNAFADVRGLFEYGFSKFVRVRLAGRGQPVAPGPGRPAELQAGADVDALVRLDHLDRVRLLAPGTAPGTAAGAGTPSGPSPTGPSRSGPSPNGPSPSGPSPSGTGGAASEAPVATWFAAGGRRLAQLPLVRLPATGPAPATPAPSAGSPSGPAPTSPAPSAGSPSGVGGPAVTTLILGTVARVGPVPPGAPPPTIDRFLRRPSP
jgi:D-alanyl-D-alanine carboxypeptidase